MSSPYVWPWVWLVVGTISGGGALLIAGSVFLAPCAVGAVVAAVLAFAGADLWIQWTGFVATSAAAFATMRRLGARRQEPDSPHDGVGSKRLVGRVATVLDPIPDDHRLGLVQVDREQWRAETLDGSAVSAGTRVRVVDVQGTRVVVATLRAPDPPSIPRPDTSRR